MVTLQTLVQLAQETAKMTLFAGSPMRRAESGMSSLIKTITAAALLATAPTARSEEPVNSITLKAGMGFPVRHPRGRGRQDLRFSRSTGLEEVSQPAELPGGIRQVDQVPGKTAPTDR
jgi:hypothetical protein